MAALFLPLALQAGAPSPEAAPPPQGTELPARAAEEGAQEQPDPAIEADVPPVDSGVIEGRRRPGY